MIDIITAGGKVDAPVARRVSCCICEGLVAIVVPLGGGLAALRAAAVATGTPFAAVLLVTMWSTCERPSSERRGMKAVVRPAEQEPRGSGGPPPERRGAPAGVSRRPHPAGTVRLRRRAPSDGPGAMPRSLSGRGPGCAGGLALPWAVRTGPEREGRGIVRRGRSGERAMSAIGSGVRAWAASVVLLATAGAAAGQEGRGERALALVNEARAAEELAPLERDERLAAAARAHAEDMAARDYYAHTSPEGGTVRDRFLDEGGGRWRLVSENIARCRGCPVPPGPERVGAFHEGWMGSPEHREAILDPGLERFGFAMAWGDDVTYGVQTFAGPGRPEGLEPGAAGGAASSAELRARALEAINRAREAEGIDALVADAALDDAAGRLSEDGAVRDADGALGEALAAADAGGAAVGMVAGECGGCGTAAQVVDAANFVEDWLAEPSLAATLLDPKARDLGFALTAGGAGRKAAIALIGGA